MIDLSGIESLGGQLRALKEAEKLLKDKPVKTPKEELQLAEIRARMRQCKRSLRMELERVQMKLAF